MLFVKKDRKKGPLALILFYLSLIRSLCEYAVAAGACSCLCQSPSDL